MNLRRFRFVYLFLLAFHLVACESGEAEVEATVEQAVAAAAAATLTALPSHTPWPTLTSPPTHTPEPSFTPLPPIAPQATYTAQPSLTPQPTYTPPPSPTPTTTPVVVEPLPTLVANPPAATGFTFDASYVGIVRNRMDRVIAYMFPRTAPIDRSRPFAPRDTNYNVDCANMVTSYEFLVEGLIEPPTSLDAIQQAALADYQTATTLFTTTLDDFVETCRTYLANQQEGWRLNTQETGLILTTITEVKSLLQNAINLLSSE